MLYYQYEYQYKGAPIADDRKRREDLHDDILKRSMQINRKAGKKARFYVSDISNVSLTMCSAVETQHATERLALADSFLLDLGLKGKRKDSSEITIVQFLRLLSSADHNSFIADEDEVKRELGLDAFGDYRNTELEESLIERAFSKKQAAAQCRNLLCGTSMLPELERIFTAGSPQEFYGHPVHYVIMSDDIEVRNALRELLLGSLIQAKRLLSRRVCFVSTHMDHFGRQRLDLGSVAAMYNLQYGGTAMIQSASSSYGETFSPAAIKQISVLMRAHRRSVLTIIELNKSDSTSLKQWKKLVPDVPLVCLEEEPVVRKTASAYLKRKAKSDGVSDTESLLTCLPPEKKGFLLTELNQTYEKWYGDRLRTVIYPQYQEYPPSRPKTDTSLQDSALTELDNMIGLSDVKETIHKMIDYHAAQKLFEQHGIKRSQPAMHMIFTGNPGTAKTTVARLVARIMKENDLLSVGDLVETGRADLVDRYIGGTAPKVRNLFERAKGSVLFIDEAYSLMDYRSGHFGDEAISTIVQEMENERHDTAVIFAGYASKMDDFLKTNPGLRSRIAFHVSFTDYSLEELMAVLNLISTQEGMRIEASALPTIQRIIAEAMYDPDFGNGRFVRNVFEQARMNQARRLMSCENEERSERFLRTMIADDFILSTGHPKKQMLHPIGFRL